MTYRDLFTLVGLATLTPIACAAGPEEDIAARSGSFEVAFAAGDAAAIAALYTEDAVLLPDDGARIEGRAAAQSLWQAYIDAGVGDFDLNAVSFDVLGDTAIEDGTYSLSAPDGNGGRVNATGKYIVVWKNRDGAWFLHWDIWNSDPAG